MKIVSFTGPKGSGKDTSADYLIESKRIDGKLSFAGPLKEICSEVFELHSNQFNDAVHKERPFKEPIVVTAKLLRAVKNLMMDTLDPYKYGYNPNKATVNGLEGRSLVSPRHILQFIGTDFIRNRIDENWHLKAAFAEERLAKLKGSVYAVTDARFLNEYEFLKNRFGEDYLAFYVERPEAEAILAQATHSSETGVLTIKNALGPEFIIVNDGDKKALYTKLDGLKLPEKEVKAKAAKGSKFKFVPKGN